MEDLEIELNELRRYINCEVHQNCDYDMYVDLSNILDEIERLVEELQNERT